MNIFRFRNECPDGKLTKQHLKTLFEKVFPDGIQLKMNAQYSELSELASELELFILSLLYSCRATDLWFLVCLEINLISRAESREGRRNCSAGV